MHVIRTMSPAFVMIMTGLHAGEVLVVQNKAHSRRRGGHRLQCCAAAANGQPQGPVIVVDNYDSFTYNLCQVKNRLPVHTQRSNLRRSDMHDLTCMCLLTCRT